MTTNETATIIIWILVVFLLILIMYSYSLDYQYNQVLNYPKPQCYNDWLVQRNINGTIQEVNIAQEVLFGENSVQEICSPLTENNICNFTYTNSSGQLVTEKPGNYVNTWSTASGCSESNNYAGCPFYKEGDIYWRACYNQIPGNYYNNDTRTYGPENTSSGNCG